MKGKHCHYYVVYEFETGRGYCPMETNFEIKTFSDIEEINIKLREITKLKRVSLVDWKLMQCDCGAGDES